MPMLLLLLQKTVGSMLIKMATQSMLEWVLLWVADMIVESTKTPHDDRLLKQIKEALNAKS